MYPIEESEANLAVMERLAELCNTAVGYSDHTIGVEIPVMAVASGAKIIEKHFTLNTQDEGPDHALSADPSTLTEMVKNIRRMETILGKPEMRLREIEQQIKPYRRHTD